MKKLLPALLLLLAFAACKKDASDLSGTVITTKKSADTLTVAAISPASGASNTLVTITGVNFGTSVTAVNVRFSGVYATVQSVTATAIKVLVPGTVSGPVSVTLGGKTVTGPLFTYAAAQINGPYSSGDVALSTQAQVDAFVAANKGKQLQLTGNLFIGVPNFYGDQSNDISSLTGLTIITSVSGQLFVNNINLADAAFLNNLTAIGSIGIYASAFTSLNFANLKSFSGSMTLSSLGKLSTVHINFAPAAGSILIGGLPLLTDLSFLSTLSSAADISLSGLGASTIAMDNLATLSSLSISSNSSLTSLSFKALATVANPPGTTASSLLVSANAITITYCPLLASLNFNALASVAGRLTLRYVNITDLSGFSALQSLGALQLDNDPALISLHGLERLTSLTLPAINNGGLNPGSSTLDRVNGIYLTNNAKLNSLSGLQNIPTVPVAYITGNALLNDLCPFKTSINTLKTAAGYSYSYYSNITDDVRKTTSIAALTLTGNGNYATTADALAAVALCK